MSLKATLEADLRSAMRGRDPAATSTLRMLLAAVRNEEVAGESARDLSDAEVQRVVAREAKKRAEAAAIYRQAGRTELADKEQAEEAFMARYLPAELSDAELDSLITDAVAATGATDMRGMGPVMKHLTPLVAGRADGRRVSERVRARLS